MGVHYHAHLFGREMYAELRRGNEAPIDLGSADVWHFDDQYLHNLLTKNFTFRSGDRLQMTCVMDSTARAWISCGCLPTSVRITGSPSIWRRRSM